MLKRSAKKIKTKLEQTKQQGIKTLIILLVVAVAVFFALAWF
jgi:hypothetical protein